MSSGISFVVALAVMAMVSRIPGLAVPLTWWIVGLSLALLISAPITRALAGQSDRIARLNADFGVAYADLKRLTDIDTLTGTLDRAAVDARVAAARVTASGWFLLVDVDHFEGINDACGHAAGDAALRHIGALLKAVVGPSAIVGRIGGEKFATWLPTAPCIAPSVTGGIWCGSAPDHSSNRGT